jgi:hypothetical protein
LTLYSHRSSPPHQPAAAASSRPAAQSGARCAPIGPESRRRRSGPRTLRSAPNFERVVSSVTVTDPRHPLFGQVLKLLSLTCGQGPAFIAVALPDGRRRLVRRAATDLERPLTPPSSAQPRISVRTLLPLARHIRSMLLASSEGACHANTLFPPGSPAPSAAGGTTPLAPATMASDAGNRANAAGTADRPSASARPRRGGAPC